jgi:hypothetical protein
MSPICSNRSEKNRNQAILLEVGNSPKPFVQNENAGLYNSSGIAEYKAARSSQASV